MRIDFTCPREEFIELFIEKFLNHIANEFISGYDTAATMDRVEKRLILNTLTNHAYKEEVLHELEHDPFVVIEKNPEGQEGWLEITQDYEVQPQVLRMIEVLRELCDLVVSLPPTADMVRAMFQTS